MFIKLNRQTVANHDFPNWLNNKLSEHAVKAEQLVFEISEQTLNLELRNLSMLSNALEIMGCSLAIEHFRMEANEQHLQHVAAEYIKIDSGLIQNVSTKKECLSKVRQIVEFAGQHKYTTIAAGVESPASLAILYELGIDFAQGFLIQAPSGNIDFEFDEIISDSENDINQKATFTIS
jgi:EAL domain-containing protein (putative c-di-GMP-specific phosphodiesterase class I)